MAKAALIRRQFVELSGVLEVYETAVTMKDAAFLKEAREEMS